MGRPACPGRRFGLGERGFPSGREGKAPGSLLTSLPSGEKSRFSSSPGESEQKKINHPDKNNFQLAGFRDKKCFNSLKKKKYQEGEKGLRSVPAHLIAGNAPRVFTLLSPFILFYFFFLPLFVLFPSPCLIGKPYPCFEVFPIFPWEKRWEKKGGGGIWSCCYR